MTLKLIAHMTQYEKPLYTYDNFDNLIASRYTKSDGNYSCTQQAPYGKMLASRRLLIIRPLLKADGSTGIKVLKSGQLFNASASYDTMSQGDLNYLVGMQIGTMMDIPVFLGSPVHQGELGIKGVPMTNFEFTVQTPLLNSGQPVVMIAGYVYAILMIFIAILATALVAITDNIWGSQSRVQLEETLLKEMGIQALLEGAKIVSDTTSGNVRTVIFGNGDIWTQDLTTGTWANPKQGYTEEGVEHITDPPTSQDLLTQVAYAGLIIFGLTIGGYIVYRLVTSKPKKAET